jgi:subtilisin
VYKQVNFAQESSLDDKNGHGTHVAGTIGALDDGKGVVGVAPGARIWSVKVLGANGSGRMSDIIAGIDYVTSNASSIEVANMSLGCECQSDALNESPRCDHRFGNRRL